MTAKAYSHTNTNPDTVCFPSNNGTPVERRVRKASGLMQIAGLPKYGTVGDVVDSSREGEQMLNMRKVGMALVGAVFVTACQDNVTTPTDAPVVMAAVTVDANTGIGFVGKGDVQYTFTWNNQALQANAALVRFRRVSSVVTSSTWECTKTVVLGNGTIKYIEQLRANTTTSTFQGIITSIARERNQITGFNLSGYLGTPTSTSTVDGPAINACPNEPNALWELTTPAGDPVLVSSTGGMEVSKDSGLNFTALLSPPVIVP
jgi:hypothetical protein